MEMFAVLLLSAMMFVLTHLGLPRKTFREVLINILGENGYLGFYSLIAFATLGVMIYQYGNVSHLEYVWAPSAITVIIGKVLMLFAVIFLVLGLSAKNPTSVKMESAVNLEPRGILRITRHPVQWGILIFSLAHLQANGDVASIIFFSSFILVSGVGMACIDEKRKKALDADEWQGFIALTSYVPFAAILSGRNQLKLGELGLIKIVLALGIYVALIYFHGNISSVALYNF